MGTGRSAWLCLPNTRRTRHCPRSTLTGRPNGRVPAYDWPTFWGIWRKPRFRCGWDGDQGGEGGRGGGGRVRFGPRLHFLGILVSPCKPKGRPSTEYLCEPRYIGRVYELSAQLPVLL